MVNLRTPFLLAHCTAGSMREPGSAGSCISRVAAFTGGIIGPHYAASKAGPRGLTHFLAFRLAATRVTVNMLRRRWSPRPRCCPATRPRLPGRCRPTGLGQPSQVAGLAAAILAKANLTNQVISLDGGIYPRKAPDGIHPGVQTPWPGSR